MRFKIYEQIGILNQCRDYYANQDLTKYKYLLFTFQQTVIILKCVPIEFWNILYGSQNTF